jgi:hypothetical protein
MRDADRTRDAGRLVALSLGARSGPLTDEHAALVMRYLADPDDRRITDELIDGLGMRRLDAHAETGLVLVAEDDSPFRMRIGDFFPRQVQSVQRRMLLACAMTACFVAFFPRPEDLEDTRIRLRRLDVDEIEGLVRDVATRLEAEARERGEELDPPTDEPNLVRAWAAWRQTSNSRKGTDGREIDRGTRQLVVRCLDLLAEQGLVRPVPKGKTYVSTRRMQTLARELAGSLVWSQVTPESASEDSAS